MQIVNEPAVVVNREIPDYPQEFSLPLPPTKNRLYVKGRIKTEIYRKWQWAAAAHIHVERLAKRYPRKLAAAVAVHVEVQRNNRRDLGNHWDPISDLLQLAEVIENDKQIEVIHLEWAPIEGVKVSVFPIAEQAG